MKWELINLQSIYGQTLILSYTTLLLYNILYSPLSVLFEIIYFHHKWNKTKLEIILLLVLFKDDLMRSKTKIYSIMPCSTNLSIVVILWMLDHLLNSLLIIAGRFQCSLRAFNIFTQTTIMYAAAKSVEVLLPLSFL